MRTGERRVDGGEWLASHRALDSSLAR